MTSPTEGATDAQLLDRTRAGDDAAFDELRRRYRSDGLRAARIVALDQDEADQIAEDTFEILYTALAAGHGPLTSVSPYLRTMIRRHALDAHRVADDTHEAVDPAAVEDLPRVPDPLSDVEARNLVREAFDSLPERWQRVLWFTEVEARPANALVPDLSSAASAVAALAYRAREGLRQAYLAVHLSVAVAADCQPIVPKLPAYIREALSPEDDVTVAIHLDTCLDCRTRRYELLLLVSNLRSVLAPALLGYRAGTPAATRPVAARAVASAAGGAAVAAGRAATSALVAMTAVGGLPQRLIKVAATAAVAILAVAALAWAASSAFAPTPAADAASGDVGRNDSPAVKFEESSAVGPTEPVSPAVPLVPIDPIGLLDGLPDGEAGESPDQAESSEPTTGGDAEQPATASNRQPIRDTSNNDTATSTSDDDQAGDQTSGPGSGEPTTSNSAGGGAATGAPGGGSSGGSGGGDDDPPSGSDPDPGDEPAPPADGGGSGDDEPDEDQGLLERVLCMLLC